MKNKSITVIGQVHSSDKMTTEAFYRLFRTLQPSVSSIGFVSINFKPEEYRLSRDVTVKPTLGIWDTLKAIMEVKSDLFFFWYGGHKKMVLPMLYLKLFRRKCRKIVRVDGSASRFYRDSDTLRSKILHLIHRVMEYIMFSSADVITYQYVNLPKDCKMERYLSKMKISHQYVDTDVFENTIKHKDRYFDLVYCGRFDANKGIVEFVEALDYLVNTVKRKLKVMIVGDGELRQQVRNYLIDKDLYGVNYSGYISQDEVAGFMGNSKFIVIPSHIEGVPKVVLEAIACGAIVISSRAGGLRYLIEDGITGFTINKVDKYGISEAILNAIDSPIGKRSEILQRYKSILHDYSYETVVNQYKSILNNF